MTSSNELSVDGFSHDSLFFPSRSSLDDHPLPSHLPLDLQQQQQQQLLFLQDQLFTQASLGNVPVERRRYSAPAGGASRIKKPLNAFMLFMKEMRRKIRDECTVKESAAINQIMGRKWRSLERGEQARYYELARKEKLAHKQRFPGWSASDNYAKKARTRRYRDRIFGRQRNTTTVKKCPAYYGPDQQNRWCKPCRRKQRCIRFLDDGDHDTSPRSQSPASSAPMAKSTSEPQTPPSPPTAPIPASRPPLPPDVVVIL